MGALSNFITFRFSRDVGGISYFDLSKELSDPVKYSLYSEGKLAGEFFYSKDHCFIMHDNKRIDFNIIRKFFSNDIITLIDAETKQVIGSIDKPRGWRRMRVVWEGVTIRDVPYQFEVLQPDVRYSIFKKDTWGHYKFYLQNHLVEIIYAFKVDMPVLSVPNFAAGICFEGTVETTEGDLLPMLAGLYIIEDILQNEGE